VKGHGDPFLVTEYLWKLLHGLRDRGLRNIAGDLVIDNGYFKPETTDSGAFDGKPHRTYNAVPDAVLVNFQSIHFTFLPDEDSRKVRIIADPWPTNLSITNGLRFKRGPCRGSKFRIGMRVTPHAEGVRVGFSGDYPSACGAHRWNRVVLKPAEMLYGVIKSLWEDMGGTLSGGLKVGTRSEDARLLYSIESRPLAELIRGMNKYSNNVMARQLLLTLGAEQYGPPGTEKKGVDAIEGWLRQQDLEFPDLVLENGAGLSRSTRITAENLGHFLLAAYASPFMPELLSSMPLSGLDGTMQKRFKNGPLTGKIRAKTGTLDGVSALAGYLSARKGKTYAVVIIQNHPRLRKQSAKKVQDRLLKWLAAQ
jgi:D-alanyl-D-alanine carboxypeptidase/D-alanyl-D-alanine-endopeptidase (penicillin-binding protein 4)